MKHLEKWSIWSILFLLVVFFDTLAGEWLLQDTEYRMLSAYSTESDSFRAMKLGEAVAAAPSLDIRQIAALMAENGFDLTGIRDLSYDDSALRRKKPVEYQKLCQAYTTILQDLRYFPIPASTDPKVPPVSFENSWQEERTYGGKRGHEGCDIMGMERPRGFYPVISMSDGIVEKVGWLEQGGWRIGIRTPKGAYLYYAHLHSYSREWKEGDVVGAGEWLGFMGDSGYSATPGTVGNFPVHLHLGIYFKTDHQEECSVNPYWILKHFMKFQLKYAY